MSSRLPRPVLAVLLAASAGCAVGPDYHPPALAVGAQAPLVSVTPMAESTSEPPERWWELYHEPLLDRYLEPTRT
jgi:outer membrane protein, multidrug efflux system